MYVAANKVKPIAGMKCFGENIFNISSLLGDHQYILGLALARFTLNMVYNLKR
ncbi:hypothetical protein SAMN04487976_105271 [Xaviernesmea oryzae]|nr:hypothetical protein SAMN04487976_105271 [Xaviernesmea oryzae]